MYVKNELSCWRLNFSKLHFINQSDMRLYCNLNDLIDYTLRILNDLFKHFVNVETFIKTFDISFNIGNFFSI